MANVSLSYKVSKKEDNTLIESMSHKKILLDKLFPKINGVNIHNLLIDNESLLYITTPYDSKYITEIISHNLSKYKAPQDSVIIDATGGAGGDTIMFSTIFRTVISVERDIIRYNFLKHNVKEYGLKNVITINSDSINILPKITTIDVIYIDPPWGGKSYKTKENLRLEFGSIPIEQFVINCFNENILISPPKLIALKLPMNYDLKYFHDFISEKYDAHLYKLKKFNILIIKKIINVTI
jgi:hypothetical protein